MADYTERPLSFKVRKVLRYTRMYGIRRTLNTVQGQYHVKREYKRLPAIERPAPSRKKSVGAIGCGIFGFGCVGYYLNRRYGKVIRGVADHNANRAASMCKYYGGDYYTDSVDELLDDPSIQVVFIATNHASHAEYAVQALERGKHVHIEKPHVTSEEQLHRLCETIARTGGKARLGFNRPLSPLGQKVKAALDAQSGRAILNWHVAGAPLPRDHWYFKPEEGGRVLGNLCHWTDFIFQMTPAEQRFPITIQPTKFDAPDENMAVTFLFGNGSIGAITYSAMGQPFEGDKERFTAHRADCLLGLDDFHRLQVEVEHDKKVYTPFFRDHGHDYNLSQSYEMANSGAPGNDLAYIWDTGLLFLKTKQALDEGRSVTIEKGFDRASLPSL